MDKQDVVYKIKNDELTLEEYEKIFQEFKDDKEIFMAFCISHTTPFFILKYYAKHGNVHALRDMMWNLNVNEFNKKGYCNLTKKEVEELLDIISETSFPSIKGKVAICPFTSKKTLDKMLFKNPATFIPDYVFKNPNTKLSTKLKFIEENCARKPNWFCDTYLDVNPYELADLKEEVGEDKYQFYLDLLKTLKIKIGKEA